MSAGAVKKAVLAAALAGCALLSGCSALLDRSYSVVEPYADRYWDSGAEDTMQVDNYQDLVNSLVMLIEQRAEEAVIRCYEEVSAYQEILQARNEVRWETMLGSYLLENIRFTFEEEANYSTAAFHMSYREDAEDLSGLMILSDSQSLVDLLRLAVREEHGKLTARFIYDMPKEAVTAAVESYWQELCREEMESEAEAVSGEEADVPAVPPDGEAASGETEEPEEAPEETPEAEPGPEEAVPAESVGEDGEPVSGPPEGGEEEPVPEPIVYPPCPWIVRFYPNQDAAEVVEILLKKP